MLNEPPEQRLILFELSCRANTQFISFKTTRNADTVFTKLL